MTEKQYPELPTHFMLVQESFRDEVYLYTSDQMRAYVDADRAMRDQARAALSTAAQPPADGALNTTNTNAAHDNCTILPDGSAFALASYPLPKNHWLYAPREYEPGAEEPKELPHPILTHAFRAEVVAAVRYAIRGATMCGKEPDFDPDALVQNAVYALCGPFKKTAFPAAAQPPADGAQQ